MESYSTSVNTKSIEENTDIEQNNIAQDIVTKIQKSKLPIIKMEKYINNFIEIKGNAIKQAKNIITQSENIITKIDNDLKDNYRDSIETLKECYQDFKKSIEDYELQNNQDTQKYIDELNSSSTPGQINDIYASYPAILDYIYGYYITFCNYFPERNYAEDLDNIKDAFDLLHCSIDNITKLQTSDLYKDVYKEFYNKDHDIAPLVNPQSHYKQAFTKLSYITIEKMLLKCPIINKTNQCYTDIELLDELLDILDKEYKEIRKITEPCFMTMLGKEYSTQKNDFSSLALTDQEGIYKLAKLYLCYQLLLTEYSKSNLLESTEFSNIFCSVYEKQELLNCLFKSFQRRFVIDNRDSTICD